MNSVKPISKSSIPASSPTTININIMTPATSNSVPVIQSPTAPAPVPVPPPQVPQAHYPHYPQYPPPPPPPPPPPYGGYGGFGGPFNNYYPNAPFYDNYRFFYIPWGGNNCYNSCGPIRSPCVSYCPPPQPICTPCAPHALNFCANPNF